MISQELQLDVPMGEDGVRQYLSEIRKFPRLSPQEEREIARRCAQGDKEAIRTMVNSNLRLVVHIAGEYAGRGVPLLDLIQEGSIGLLAAARKFDYTLECRFSTYATKWIRQGVTRCLMNHGQLIRVPLYTAERMRRLEEAREAIKQETGEVPDAQALARRLELPVEKVQKLLQLTPETCSLDMSLGEEAEGSLQQLLEDERARQPYEELVRQELSRMMDTLLTALPERQQRVLRMRFGMEDGKCYAFEEIGNRLGVTRERARQIERQAVERLQKLGEGMGLEDFLNE